MDRLSQSTGNQPQPHIPRDEEKPGQVYRLHQKPDAQRELWQGPVRHDESVLRPTAGALTCQKRTQKQVPQDVEMNKEISKFHSHKSSLSETESVFKK